MPNLKKRYSYLNISASVIQEKLTVRFPFNKKTVDLIKVDVMYGRAVSGSSSTWTRTLCVNITAIISHSVRIIGREELKFTLV